MNKIRLIVKVPRTTQVAPEAWVDTTHYTAFEVDVSDEVYNALQGDATIVGGHRIEGAPNDGTN